MKSGSEAGGKKTQNKREKKKKISFIHPRLYKWRTHKICVFRMCREIESKVGELAFVQFSGNWTDELIRIRLAPDFSGEEGKTDFPPSGGLSKLSSFKIGNSKKRKQQKCYIIFDGFR